MSAERHIDEMVQRFNRTDRIFHLVAIPVFTLLAVFLIKGSEPDFWEKLHTNFLEPFFWVLFIWLCNRQMIVWLQKRFVNRNKLFPRLFYQLGLSLLIGVIAALGSNVLHATVIDPEKTLYECFVYTQKIVLTMLVYSLLESIVYEAFYLFVSLSQSTVEAEQYKKESMEARFENLKNQLNPHFLFNSFNTLTNIIEENPKEAVHFVGELSKLYRYVLSSQKVNWVRLEDEVDMIRSYLFLQQQRHEENLQVNWKIDETLNKWWLPPLGLQVLVENAIKHNEISSEKPLTIHIEAGADSILVRNRIQPKKRMEPSNGIGLSNLKKRYEFLAEKTVHVVRTTENFEVRLPLLQLLEK